MRPSFIDLAADSFVMLTGERPSRSFVVVPPMTALTAPVAEKVDVERSSVVVPSTPPVSLNRPIPAQIDLHPPAGGRQLLTVLKLPLSARN